MYCIFSPQGVSGTGDETNCFSLSYIPFAAFGDMGPKINVKKGHQGMLVYNVVVNCHKVVNRFKYMQMKLCLEATS